MDTVFNISEPANGLPDFPTPALRNAWKSIIEWAVRNFASESLIHVVNTTQILKHPDFLRIILDLLTDEDSFALLCEWADANELNQNLYPSTPAQHLYQLARAAVKDESVFQLLAETQTEMPASRFMKEELRSNYLFAMLYQKPNDVGFGDHGWIRKLKLWLFVHAIDREIISGSTQDGYIKSVSDDLRIACHKNREKRKVFLALLRPITEFSALNRHLIYGAQYHQKNNTFPSKKTMLGNIVQVAKFQSNEIKNIAQLRMAIPGQSTTQANHNWRNPVQPALDEVHDDEEMGRFSWVACTTEDAGIAEAETDEKSSYFHQHLKATSILLYSLEDSNFLQWAWNRPNPYEMSQIEQWIEENSHSANPANKILAALTWGATRIKRSFRRTLDIRIADEVGDEWTINPEFSILSRRPPQRKGGWQPDSPDRNQGQKKWVNPVAESISINIPEHISKALKNQAAKSLNPLYLGNLWDSAWGEKPEKVLREIFSRTIPRVTPGMLGNVQTQHLFNASKDAVFARLSSSHPNSSLPSACAYANWNVEQANNTLNHESIALPLKVSCDGKSIAQGSRLDPIESLIVNSIREATLKLEELRQRQDVIEFHNAYASYVVVALLAATGGRPVNDTFENIAHFDFRERFVFINDKASGAARMGRLVLLPDKVCELVKHYLDHLNVLAQAIKVANPALSEELELTAKGCPSSTMPLFFFLSRDFVWRSVSEEQITSLALFDWPLPLNLFRHRMSTWLRHHGADPEVIDSILGHAETGNATHWDCSFRVWQEDMAIIRPLIEQAFIKLGFENVRGWTGELPALSTKSDKAGIRSPELFGMRAREKNRRARFMASIRDAKKQIHLYLDGRKLSELSNDQIYDLSKGLLFNDSGLPHPAGHHKYRYLLRLIEKEWHKEGKRVRVSKRFVFMGEESSLFTEAAPHAIQIFEEIKATWEQFLEQPKRHRIPTQSAAIIAAVSLCIENRISSQALLKDIRTKKNFRLVALKNRVYIEYAKDLMVNDPDATAKRFRISGDTATNLNQILVQKPLELANHPVPDALQPIARILAAHRRVGMDARSNELISALCELVDQINALTQPGILAAYLAGRVDSYSLTWRDWIRMELGYVAEIPVYEPDKKEIIEEDPDTNSVLAGGQVNIQHLINMDIEASQRAGQELLRNIDKLLTAFEKYHGNFLQKAAVILGEDAPQASPLRRAERKDLARAINSMIRKNGSKTSSAIQLLAKWSTSLIFRKVSGGSKLITISSVTRYLDALSAPFVKTGYAMDILLADDDEMTDFYTEVLDALEVKDTDYAKDCLKWFHRWARKNYAIEDPDWVELPVTFSGLRVSPGVITEAEYQRALHLLMAKPGLDARTQLAPAFLLLCCYRFAMRSGEAFGLLRKDWVAYPYTAVALVHNNKFRKLKTPTSRRQLPLVFELSKLEKEIIDHWLGHAESVHGADMTMPLFFDENASDKLMTSSIKKAAIDVLKASTGNPRITLHHARHAAANRIALAIGDINLEMWSKLYDGAASADMKNIPVFLLGDNRPSRRKSWSIARYLGHVRILTTFRNYLHFLGEWADSLQEWGERGHAPLLRKITILDNFPRAPTVEVKFQGCVSSLVTDPTPYTLLKFMRLVARGRPCKEAGVFLGLDPKLTKKLEDMLLATGQRVRVRKIEGWVNEASESAPFPFLYRVKESAWKRLIDFAVTLKKDIPESGVPSHLHIAWMVGANRQIVMWEEWQFSLMRSMLEYFGIDQSRYQIFHTEQIDSELIACAEKYRFTPLPRNAWKSKIKKKRKKKKKEQETLIQVDAVHRVEGTRERVCVDVRCAIVWTEDDESEIRSSFELIAIFCAFAFSAYASSCKVVSGILCVRSHG